MGNEPRVECRDRTVGEQVKSKERKFEERFVGYQRTRRVLSLLKLRNHINQARFPQLFSFLASSNLTPSILCHRQMPDSIEEIPKEGDLRGRIAKN